MSECLKYRWIAAFHQGYFTNKDVSELLNIGAIKYFYEVMSADFLNSFENIECSLVLKQKLKEIKRQYGKINTYAEQIAKKSSEIGSYLIAETDADYPFYWKQLSGMPRIVFAKGNRELIKTDENGAVAIVGSRRCSNYSKVATAEFTLALVKKGITIVSGMADGIDRVAHEVALDHHGKTIAFLAGGIDNIYPWINKDIYERIIQDGLLISEMPPGTKAQKQYFPSRNRLISGISDTCLIMEAGCHSGTLHTASFAAAQGKTVFVLPNTIYAEDAIGGLSLIADGARIMLSPDDVISEVAECCFYRIISKGNSYELLENKDQSISNVQRITDQLSVRPRTADELVKLTSISYTELSVILSEMEIKGSLIVERGKFTLTR